MVGFFHLGIATAFKCPEMELSESEQTALATATVNVLSQFNTVVDPKITAIVGLATTSAGIYGPRIYLINKRKSEEKAKKKAASANDAGLMSTELPNNIHPFGVVN